MGLLHVSLYIILLTLMHKARICHRFVSPISNLKVKGESGRAFSLCYDAILSGSKGVA